MNSHGVVVGWKRWPLGRNIQKSVEAHGKAIGIQEAIWDVFFRWFNMGGFPTQDGLVVSSWLGS